MGMPSFTLASSYTKTDAFVQQVSSTGAPSIHKSKRVRAKQNVVKIETSQSAWKLKKTINAVNKT